VTTLVIDASIAVKWVVEEEGTAEALALRRKAKLIAPDLLVPECANIFWKKVQRKELTLDEADLAARLLQGADLELVPMRPLLDAATKLAVALDHPAYDCTYLALAIERDCRFITADGRLLRKLAQTRRPSLRARTLSLLQTAQL
jgi:predicted nucleic acid-binding protein